MHPNINARYSRFKIRDCIRQAKSEWKLSDISVKRIGKGLNKLFKVFVK